MMLLTSRLATWFDGASDATQSASPKVPCQDCGGARSGAHHWVGTLAVGHGGPAPPPQGRVCRQQSGLVTPGVDETDTWSPGASEPSTRMSGVCVVASSAVAPANAI